jgi:hypothetical protein
MPRELTETWMSEGQLAFAQRERALSLDGRTHAEEPALEASAALKLRDCCAELSPKVFHKNAHSFFRDVAACDRV